MSTIIGFFAGLGFLITWFALMMFIGWSAGVVVNTYRWTTRKQDPASGGEGI